eukprot:761772-Hanusia_phi.AAC.2
MTVCKKTSMKITSPYASPHHHSIVVPLPNWIDFFTRPATQSLLPHIPLLCSHYSQNIYVRHI